MEKFLVVGITSIYGGKMKIKRRQFLKLSLTQSALTLLTSRRTFAHTEPEEDNFRFIQRDNPSILQGATGETSTQFSVVYKNGVELKAVAEDDKGQLHEAYDAAVSVFNEQLPAIHKFYFKKLDPESTYFLKIIDKNNDDLLDEREFQTLNLNKGSLRFAFGSCMEDTRHDPEIWKDLEAQKPDVMFFIGDSVYADRDGFGQFSMADPERLWERFSRARATLEFFFIKRLIPCIATWDDHDFGYNDADSTEYPFVSESQKNFLNFYAQDNSDLKNFVKGPGVSSAYYIGSHVFILMDNRSFRKKRGSKERYAHWGKEQELWMTNIVNQHEGASWIMNGSQMFPSMPFKESFSRDHKENFNALINELKESTSKLLFCSGDVHFSEVTQIDSSIFGYKTYELTSSSIHSRGTPPWLVPNLNRIKSAGKRNYLLVETELKGNTDLRVSSRSSEDEINFEIFL